MAFGTRRQSDRQHGFGGPSKAGNGWLSGLPGAACCRNLNGQAAGLGLRQRGNGIRDGNGTPRQKRV